MPRPFKCRRVHHEPAVRYFKPRAMPLAQLSELLLTVDELEALRLADLQGMYHGQAARRMNVSRQTFGNIVESARKKVADALVNGKAIRISGGCYRMSGKRKFRCYHCGHTWQVEYGTPRPGRCPSCDSANIHRAEEDRGFAARRGPRRCGRPAR